MKKQWDGEYLQQAIADEIELAHVKLRRRITAPSVVNVATDLYPNAPRSASPGMARHTLTPPLPRWRRTWAAAGPLSTELGLTVRHDLDEGTVSAGTGSRRRDVTEAYADHPDKDAATCAAIVRAAIRVYVEAREC